MRIVAAREGSKTISAEPEFQEVVGVLRASESAHLDEFLVQCSDDVLYDVRVSGQVWVEEMGGQ